MRHIPWDERWVESDEDLRHRLEPCVLLVLEAAEMVETTRDRERAAVAEVAEAIPPASPLNYKGIEPHSGLDHD